MSTLTADSISIFSSFNHKIDKFDVIIDLCTILLTSFPNFHHDPCIIVRMSSNIFTI